MLDCYAHALVCTRTGFVADNQYEEGKRRDWKGVRETTKHLARINVQVGSMYVG